MRLEYVSTYMQCGFMSQGAHEPSQYPRVVNSAIFFSFTDVENRLIV